MQCSDKMKILYPKCNPQKTSQISNRIKFHMPVKNINLSLAKNLLIILAYTLANIFSGEYPLMTGFMVILGHLLAIASDSWSVYRNLTNANDSQDCASHMFFVIANIFSIIGEYKEIESTLIHQVIV